MKKLLALLIIFISFFLITGSITAQSDDTIGLSISPAIVEIVGEPGSKHKAQVNVRNTSDKALPIRLEVTSLIPIEEEIDRSRRAEFDASSWVKIDKKDVLLAPGETKLVSVDVEIPKEANPGGHYAQIGFRVLSLTNYDPATNAQIVPEVAASLFITVPGEVDEKAEFNTDNLITGYVSRGDNTTFTFKIRNIGNVHILPAPKVTVFNESGEVKQFNLQPQLVLPNTQKEFTVDWPADVGFGSYSARVETVFGSQNIPLVSETSEFKVGPSWWQVLLLFIVVTPIIYLAVRRRHLPNFFKILAGKRIHLVGKRRYSRADSEGPVKPRKKVPETVGEYATIADFLGESKPVKPLVEPEIIAQPSPRITPPEPTSTSVVVEEMMGKTVEEPISDIPVSPKTTITEFTSKDDASKKTVIVQTSASTIIRQEPKKDTPQPESKPIPTIVRITPPEKPKKIIKIIDGDTPPPPIKSVQPKPIVHASRSEKVAKKVAKTQKKSQKKKI